MKPLLTIVIANYNYGRFIGDAIRSVLSQGLNGRIELIICDAASTDDSVKIIKEFADQIVAENHIVGRIEGNWFISDLISWVSEKDGGQSAAFNKGFARARGEWITWLNSDDVYLPGTLEAFEHLVSTDKSAVWVSGNKLHFDDNTKKILSINWGPHSQPPFLSKHHAFSAVFGPTTFWKKSLYEKMGDIDEKLHYAMDSEYWARLTMSGIRQTRLKHICWAFRDHEESKTAGVQSDPVVAKRKNETKYWREKTGYGFYPKFTNPWYVLWCLWRVLDGSWVKKFVLKKRYEGTVVDFNKEYK